MKRNLRNILLATLLATVTPLLAAPAMAQDMPMMPFGQGVEKLAGKLKLSPEQRKDWDAMVQKSKAQFEATRKAHRELHEAMKAELAKPEPDLAALAAKADAVRDQGRTAHREVRDGWLKLYATMNVEQKGVVKNALLKHMAKFDHMRARMHEHMHGMQGGHGGHAEHGGAKPGDAPPPKN